jgi:menaquinone-specific isochorismate synthase
MDSRPHPNLVAQVQAYFAQAECAGARYPLQRLEIDTAPRDLLAWLRCQPGTERSYWRDRNSDLEIAGLGRAFTVEPSNSRNLAHALDRIRTILLAGDAGLRFLGGVAFDRSASDDPIWEPWEGYAFWVPCIEIVRQGQTWTLAINVADQDLSGVLPLCAALNWENSSISAPMFGRIQAVQPTRDRWLETVKSVTGQLGDRLGKLVLACRQDLRLQEAVDPCLLLAALREQTGPGYDFIWQRSDCAFCGSSPERLYQRDGANVITEALAGTETVSEQRSPFRQAKEQREHDYVVWDIETALSVVCRGITSDGTKDTVTWGELRHLRTQFSATLLPNRHDGDLLQALHPSAAVLGFPRPVAWQALLQHESIQRGWYAGPMGWIGRDAAAFTVGIRSALLRGRDLSLYAGAGIVQDSDPQQEWEEVQAKMQPYLTALGIGKQRLP